MNTDEKIIERFLHLHPGVAASVIEDLEVGDMAVLIENLQPELSTIVLSQIATYQAARVLEKTSMENTLKIIKGLPANVAELIFRQMNSGQVTNILKELPNEFSDRFKRLMKYPKDSIGAYLDYSVLTFTHDIKIGTALEKIKKSPTGALSHIFIIDRDKNLIGFVELKDLLTHEEEQSIDQIMSTKSISVRAEMNIKDLLAIWDYKFTQLPVVNSKGIFMGTVTRTSLDSVATVEKTSDDFVIKAGNALGDLYLIGLTGLFGGPSGTIQNNKQ